jgi:sigma54-dependent transcription regulator
MVSIDLGATSESLFESELFGHVKGAFTGAASDRLGRLKAAVEEEEKRLEGLFAQARKAGLDMDALGQQLAERKEQLRAEIEANGIPKPRLKTLEETDV